MGKNNLLIGSDCYPKCMGMDNFFLLNGLLVDFNNMSVISWHFLGNFGKIMILSWQQCRSRNTILQFRDKMIDWFGFNPVFNKVSVISLRPVHLFLLLTTYFPSNWLLFHIDCYPIGGRWKTPVTVTYQMSGRMLAELGFKLTTPGLTARVYTDWAAENKWGNPL